MDFSTLQSNVADYLDRDDLTSQVKLFIQIAQRRLERRLNLNYMINTDATLTIDAATATVTAPTNYKEPIYWYLVNNDSKVFLDKLTPEQFQTVNFDPTPTQKPPSDFTFINGTFHLNPTSDATYTNKLGYYAYSDELDADDDTNWLTTNHPEVLIYGALLEAEPFLVHDERIQVWQTYFKQTTGEIITADNKEAISMNQRIMTRS